MTAENIVDREKLPYRETVAAIVADKQGRFLLGQKVWYEENQYDFLGGGIENETVERAALRELKEETGNSDFQTVKEAQTVNTYEWLPGIMARYFEARRQLFRGQRQHYVLVRFTGDPENLKPDPHEIKQVAWVTREELPGHLKCPGQWNSAQQALRELSSTGTEIYNLGPGVSEAEIESRDPNLELRALDPAGLLRLQVIDHTDINDPLEEYPLPRVYASLDQLRERPPLRIFWGKAPVSSNTSDVLARLLEGFEWYVTATRPGFGISTSIKIYEKYTPGKDGRNFVFRISTADLYNAIPGKIEELHYLTGNDWTGGFSGNFDIALREPTEEAAVALLDDVGSEKDSPKAMVIPLLDFDTQYSRNPQQALTQTINTLRSNGFSGWIANSGNGHHFIGDFMVPREPGLWQSLGLMTKLILSRGGDFDRHREYADRIYKATSLVEARAIAREILDPNTGIPNTDTPSIGDIRWTSHSILRGFAILRSQPFWRNPNAPEVLARIY